MATAYAAVVSVKNIMEQIKLYHARQPVFLDEQQIQLQSLNNLLSFYQDFLEGYSHGDSKREMEVLESRIAEAVHGAEDIIETHIVDDIRHNPGKKSSVKPLSQGLLHKVVNFVKIEAMKIKDKIKYHPFLTTYNMDDDDIQGERSSNPFSQGLKKVIEEMDLIKIDVLETRDKCRLEEPQAHQDPTVFVSSSSPPSGKDATLVFDEDLNHIMDMLFGQQSNLQVIPITGMGGIGKTTLAKTIYDNLSIVEYFDLRGWVTISQQYDEGKLILRLLKEIGALNDPYESPGLQLYQHLSGHRYLIIIDDIWTISAWEKLKTFLPDNNNGSRIIVTTRISNLANSFGSLGLYQMNPVNEDKSWDLLCKKVFVQETCPLEFEEIGKIIAKNCKGLPLSIGVIGGLLAKSKMVREYWEYVAENTSLTISSNDEESCLEIVSLSYHLLPIHLKPCFLYMGVFPEDKEIRVSELIRLWVAEGFLKPSRTKSLEQDAKDYLKDLIDRNLMSISESGSTGNIKYCRIHDLLRDLCLREAQKANFLHIEKMQMPNMSQQSHVDSKFQIDGGDRELNSGVVEVNTSKRRVAIHLKSDDSHSTPLVFHASQSFPGLRSLTCDSVSGPLDNFKLLRVLYGPDGNYSKHLQSTNLRYLHFTLEGACSLPSSINMFWNLQTLIVVTTSEPRIFPLFELWKMPQLRHVICNGLCLLDPPSSTQMDYDFVLENLQTLLTVRDFRLTEDVVRKIPNVVKLKLVYGDAHLKGLNNIRRLKKLQSLYCNFGRSSPWLPNHLTHIGEFPLSLRKLTLCSGKFDWEDVSTKIGTLPHLEKLKLDFCFTGDKWEPVDGQFLRLKFLEIVCDDDLVYWTAENIHFPRLEHLVLYMFRKLEEIPSGIGDIATLRSIQLFSCKDSVVASAKSILEEQQSCGNEGLSLLVDGKCVKIDSGSFESDSSE